MKFKLIYLYIAVILFASCKKEDVSLLDSPDQRITDTLNKYKKILTEKDHIWKLNYLTGNGELYNFVIKFTDNNRVQMLADLNEKSSRNYIESSYRIESLIRPSLIFDTYNYLHLLSDPDPSVNNGTIGKGSLADFSFSLLSHQADTISLYGNFNKNYAKLIKISTVEALEIENGGWNETINNFKTFYATSQYPYLKFDNTQLMINIDTTKRKLSFTLFENQKMGASYDINYAYDLKHIPFSKPITIKGNKIQRLSWDENAANFYVLINGNKHYIQNYNQYPISIDDLYGYGKKYAFLKIPSNKLDYGLNSGFNTIWQQAIDKFKTANKTIVNASFGFLDAERFEVLIVYGAADTFGDPTGASQFNAQAIFKVTKNGNSFTLDQGTLSGNWDANASHLLSFKDYFSNATFTPNWITSSYEQYNKVLMIGLFKNGSTTSFAYGIAK